VDTDYFFEMSMHILQSSDILGDKTMSDLFAGPIPIYEPLNHNVFESLFIFISYCFAFCFIVLLIEIVFKRWLGSYINNRITNI
jgi:hypothetical protein